MIRVNKKKIYIKITLKYNAFYADNEVGEIFFSRTKKIHI